MLHFHTRPRPQITVAASRAASPGGTPAKAPLKLRATPAPQASVLQKAAPPADAGPLVLDGTLSQPHPRVSHLDIHLLQAPACEQRFMLAPSHTHGAFGTVSYAQNAARERFVAKTVYLEESFEQMWADVRVTPLHKAQREVQIGRAVPGAVTSVAAINTGEQLVHVMQMMDGNWSQLPTDDPPATMLTRSLEGFSQAARCLASFHRQHMLHGDIKLENLLWTRRNVIKWGDYGVSRWIDPDGGLLRKPCGTPFAMAPEIMGGLGYGCSADMWSFGVALGEMFVGGANSAFRSARTQTDIIDVQQSVVNELGKLNASRLRRGTTPMHRYLTRWYDISPQTCRFALEELFVRNPEQRATSARASNVAKKAIEAAPHHTKNARLSMAELSVPPCRERTFDALDEAWRAVGVPNPTK